MAGPYIGQNASFHASYPVYLNWMKQGFDILDITRNGSPISAQTAWDAGDIFYDNGNFKTPLPADVTGCRIIFFLEPVGAAEARTAGWTLVGQQMTFVFTGSATVGVMPGTTNSDGLDTANRKTWTWTSEPGNSWITFTNIDPDDPPVLNTIKIYETQYESRINAGEKFDPECITDHTGWAYLRHLDTQEINSSSIEDFSDIATETYVKWCGAVAGAPVSGFPITLACEWSNLTRTPLWIHIPHKATIACIRAILECVRDNLDAGIEIFIELSSEGWNFSFGQAAYFAALIDGNNGHGYGYKAAQVMMVATDVLSIRSWRGVLGTQTVNPAVTSNNLEGVALFLTDLVDGTPDFSAQVRTVGDLFDDLAVATYFGATPTTQAITAITKANPGVVTSAAHGKSNGDRVKVFVKTGGGMVELDNTYQTVAGETTDTYQLSGTNTSAMTTFIDAGFAYTVPATIFELIDESIARNISNPNRYPTKYVYFNEQLVIDNYDGSLTFTDFSILAIIGLIEDHKVIADNNGLRVIAYEGRSHNVGGDVRLTNSLLYPPQFVEFFRQIGHTAETARGCALANENFKRAGVELGSNYNSVGLPTQFGHWGMRRWKGDTNPIIDVTSQANDNLMQIRLGVLS